MDANSPLIESVVWGEMKVEGLGSFRDVKLYPGGGREWDWSETGTHHEPGIQVADVSELILHGADNIVLSKGMLRRLKIKQETLDHLESASVMVYAAETTEAVIKYNELVREHKAVGGLFHSTC